MKTIIFNFIQTFSKYIRYLYSCNYINTIKIIIDLIIIIFISFEKNFKY
jgi:hypothetical protein